jgi:proteasome lid subunit RPN8/RPN11
MEPSEQLHAFLSFEAQGLEISGIYHSHPGGPAHPSATDINEAYYPKAVYIIWYEGRDGWECRAFRIREDSYSEVDVRIVNPE